MSIKGIHVKRGGASLHEVRKDFVLEPNECVVLETREHITTGSQALGFICSRASLASKGLIVSNLKVDPNYSDTLYITVFNAGTGRIPLEPGYPFCAVVFCQTDGVCEGETRRPDPEGIPDGLIVRLLRARPHIITFVFSVLGSIVAMLLMG